jgi:hypothetical protein
MVLLRKLFAWVRSFLIGTLHDLDDAMVRRRHVLYMQYRSSEEGALALALIRDALGVEHVHIVAQSENAITLFVKATQHSLNETIGMVSPDVLISEELAVTQGATVTQKRTPCTM